MTGLENDYFEEFYLPDADYQRQADDDLAEIETAERDERENRPIEREL